MQKLQFLLFKDTSPTTRISILGASVPCEAFDNEMLDANPDHMLSRGRAWSQNKAGSINRGGAPWIKPGQNRCWWVFGESISLCIFCVASTSYTKKDLKSRCWDPPDTSLMLLLYLSCFPLIYLLYTNRQLLWSQHHCVLFVYLEV